MSKLSLYFLHTGLPIIVATLIYITAFLLNTPPSERAWICNEAHSMLEHTFMTLTIITIGAFLADIVSKKADM